ncbi:hypothetical protein CAOG_08081 [Capsaspora owczarzaki ATCC 30864]|uniref:hypothetical protein n=1 Tax=Capsaspora owczarzaki (strain ATCC 30864) TaxID=595528 RepID=UPI0001FE38A7|nr:hypothetical protein CAOG_08081 [Capsaspora owczarzaki ATCC 30864]|eukprot:XP_004342682.1 hypothetical protein CAOG_08081 [Capsaspora owczarzaki ATCC 30864]
MVAIIAVDVAYALYQLGLFTFLPGFGAKGKQIDYFKEYNLAMANLYKGVDTDQVKRERVRSVAGLVAMPKMPTQTDRLTDTAKEMIWNFYLGLNARTRDTSAVVDGGLKRLAIQLVGQDPKAVKNDLAFGTGYNKSLATKYFYYAKDMLKVPKEKWSAEMKDAFARMSDLYVAGGFSRSNQRSLADFRADAREAAKVPAASIPESLRLVSGSGANNRALLARAKTVESRLDNGLKQYLGK